MPNDNDQTNPTSINGDNNQPTVQSNMPIMPSSFQSGTPNTKGQPVPPQQGAVVSSPSQTVSDEPRFPNPINTDDSQPHNAKDLSAIITSSHVPERLDGKKVIATIFGILFLVGGIVAGVFLAQEQQEIREKAAGFSPVDCPIGVADNRIIVQFEGHLIRSDKSETDAKFGPIGKVIPSGTYNITLVSYEKDKGGQPNESWYLKLNDGSGNNFAQTSSISDMPATESWLTEVVNENFILTQDVGSVTAFHSVYPDMSSPNSINPVCAVFDRITTPSVSASCSTVKAYDSNWNSLNSSDLSTLKTGDIVHFTISGTATSGVIDKARFTVNGTSLGENTDKKPGTDEFFVEYTIPDGVMSFTIDAQIHHSTLGWF